MKTRLIRPALTALVSGAIVAAGAVYAAPASAEPTTPVVTENDSSESPSPSPSESASESESPSPSPSVSESESQSPSPSPSVSESSSSPSPSVSVSPSPDKDVKGPTKANFTLNHTALWLGQVVTFSQTAADLADPTDDVATLARVVTWGDGTTTKLAAGTTSVRKTYSRSGSFKVTVTVTDPAGNKLVTPAKTVAVTTATGSVSISKTTVYQGAPFTVKVNKIPAGATYFRIDWSDGWPSVYKAKNGASATSSVLYQWRWNATKGRYELVSEKKLTGKRPIKIAWYNAKGYSVNQSVATVNLLKDSWLPALKITKPGSVNKASSWRTIRGTASDKGAGATHVRLTVQRKTTAGKWYCLTPAKKWKRIYSQKELEKSCWSGGALAKISKGKWSLKLPAGIARNQSIKVQAWIYDNADNYRGRELKAKITRN